MKKVISMLLALCLCTASLSVGLFASAAAEPMVWDFAQDTQGWEKAADQPSSTNTHDGENGRINIAVQAGWGTAGIVKTFDQLIDGSQYQAIKITMAQAASGVATVKEIQGYVGYTDEDDANLETADYQEAFTASASGDLFDVTVPFTKDTWKTNQIQDIRIGFDIAAQA